MFIDHRDRELKSLKWGNLVFLEYEVGTQSITFSQPRSCSIGFIFPISMENTHPKRFQRLRKQHPDISNIEMPYSKLFYLSKGNDKIGWLFILNKSTL